MSLRRYFKWVYGRLCSCKRIKSYGMRPFMMDSNPKQDGSVSAESTQDGCKIKRKIFKQILRDRASEVKRKAEGQRRDEMLRIANMTPRDGLSPLELIPKEIWVKILDKLKPLDRANMRHVHSVFRDLLESTLIQDTLLPLVIDYKIPLVQMFLIPVVKTPIFPYFDRAGIQKLKELMTLRLVCKCICESVDRWFEERLLHHMQTAGPEREEQPLLNAIDFYLTQSRKVLDKIPDYSSGPIASRPKRFFVRSLAVDFSAYAWAFKDVDSEDDDVWLGRLMGGDQEGRREIQEVIPEQFFILKDNITELLDNVGDQVLHFNLSFGIDCRTKLGVPQSLEQVYAIVRDWLTLVPNLKWLSLQGFGLVPSMSPVNERMMMPKLRNLERFDLDGNEVASIGNAILASNPHIKIHHRESACYIDSDPLVLAQPLETAQFGDHTTGFTGHPDLSLLQMIPDNNWNLKRMTLWLRKKEGMNSIGAVLLFIGKFQTLEDLDIHVDHISIGEKIDFLRLPNLQDLWIEFGPKVEYSGDYAFFFSLQFLFHCSKLRTLVWQNVMENSLPLRQSLEHMRRKKKGIWVDFMGGNLDLSKSNIWNVFPYLTSVKVKFGEGARIGTRKFCRRKYHKRKLVKEHNSLWSHYWILSSRD